LAAMVSHPLKIRRATIEDLNPLRAIWNSMRLPSDALEKQLKEFQVAENENGEIAGAIGIQFSNQHALLYAEGFSDFSVADAARELFWERIQTLAANHGIFRIWTQENSPFWLRWGFQPANAEITSRLPSQWNTGEGKWFTLQLKDEDAVAAALQNKFVGFMEAEKNQTARISEKAKTIKIAVTIIGLLIFLACVAAAIYLLRRNPLQFH
jgi:N-acetylglutamate synthase-like GNAT family acetyltransferase